jgi:hypothetical protein
MTRIWIALFVGLDLLAPEARAAPQTACPDSLASVTAEDTETIHRVCDIAARADIRFNALGLGLIQAISIVITETLDAAPDHYVALFNTARNELQVLPEHCLEGRPGRLGYFPEMLADVFFDSLLVHELSHAYFEQTAGAESSRLAHEYLAYALQLDALPAAQRDLILAEADIDRPVVLSDFNEALLGFAPQRYAALAWLHFSAQPNPRVTVRGLLDGTLNFYSLRE